MGPATTQNVVVKFDGEVCGGVLVEMLLTIFPSKKLENLLPTSPEVRHEFRRKLRQLHSGNRCCLLLWGVAKGSSVSWVAKFKGDKNPECKLLRKMGGRDVTR